MGTQQLTIDQIFPIEITKRCPLKIGWSTIFLWENMVASCHRTGRMPIPEDFNFIHNNERRRSERVAMNNNLWPKESCNYCKSIEESGGMSDRILQINNIKNYNRLNLIPSEIISNPDSVDVTMTMMEIYFSNVCNMSCIYCKPELSSKWVEENKRFGEHDIRFDILDDTYNTRLKKFWQWLPSVYHDLKVLNVLGGEPFVQPELEQMIDFLLKSDANTDLKFGIFSNLKISRSRLETILSKLRILKDSGKVKSISIKCSIDCWGDSQEYVRYGMKLSEWESNFQYILNNYKWIDLSIASTICSLTIKDTSELLRKVKDFNNIRHVPIGFNLLSYPAILHPGVFGAGTFDSDFEEIVKEIAVYEIGKYNLREHMMGIWESINNHTSEYSIEDLKCYLDKLDSRRNTNWKDTFSWILRNE